MIEEKVAVVTNEKETGERVRKILSSLSVDSEVYETAENLKEKAVILCTYSDATIENLIFHGKSILILSTWPDLSVSLPVLNGTYAVGGSLRRDRKVLEQRAEKPEEMTFRYSSLSLLLDTLSFIYGTIDKVEKTGNGFIFYSAGRKTHVAKGKQDLPLLDEEGEIKAFISSLREDGFAIHTLQEHIKSEKLASRITGMKEGEIVIFSSQTRGQAYNPDDGIVLEWMGRAEGMSDEQ